eukprot:Plantae.Rhodophyta-Purpureofilum_apyrenoidigerum.ctg811.p1 GENE.Plantae.Rhodophyta-Purpureofilum_apyrenoidigerum.ctg811~~Plantae.Rhodophyta-Purpureofilum_apyrenoidigerum.ctg811.p1  ORF type:complete len:403 (-),score=44.66 Plantae.Rhodophyta-Purpureofilum_apyrenoidigerum.ctg811:197-1405(-)
MSPGSQLPREVLTNVFCNLDLRGLTNASLVCSEWADVVKSSNEVWERRFMEDFVAGTRGGRESLMRNCARFAMQKQAAVHVYRAQVSARKPPKTLLNGVHEEWIWDVDLIGDEYAVSCSQSAFLVKWRVGKDALQSITRLNTSEGQTDVVVHPESGLVLTCQLGVGRGLFRLCSLETGEILKSHESDCAVKMALAGDLVLCAGMDDRVRVIKGLFDEECEELQEIVLRGHSDWVRDICYLPNFGDPYSAADKTNVVPGAALSSADDSTICLFDLEREVPLLKMFGRAGSQAAAVEASHDGRYGASGHTDGSIQLWDLRAGKAFLELGRYGEENIHSLAFTRDGITLLAGSSLRVGVWDLRSTRNTVNLRYEACGVSSVCVSQSGRNAFICSGNNLLCWPLCR